MSSIVTLAEADAAAEYISEFQVWHTVVATGTHQELNWVKYAPGSIYPLHSESPRENRRPVCVSHAASDDPSSC